MAKRKAPRTAFKPGQSGNPKGRKPKAVEVSELQRLVKWAQANGIPDLVLAKIGELIDQGDKWALQWFADRYWPAQAVSNAVAPTETTGNSAQWEEFKRLVAEAKT